MKYDDVSELLSDQVQQLLRHGSGRGLNTWTVPYIETVKISQAIADVLGPVFVIPTNFSPLDTLPKQFQDSIFLARLADGQLFLVNTEGYDYSRYIAFADIRGPKTMDMFEKHLNVDIVFIEGTSYGYGTILRSTDPARFVELFDAWDGPAC